MLKVLRNKKTAKKVWIGLAIIIIPAFAFFGFGGAMRSKEENAPVGKIFGHTISSLEFKDSLLAVKTTALMQYGDKFTQVEKYLNLKAQAWERLVLLYEAKKRRILVNDDEVIQTIQKIPFFQNKSGFSNKIYIDTLRYGFGLQPRTFEEQMRQSLILSKLYQQVTDPVKLDADQTRQEYLKINQELSIYYIASLFSEFAKNTKPDEKEIADYFEKNKEMFKLPGDKDKPAYIPELAAVKNKVKEALVNEKSKKTAQTKINECAEKLKTLEFKKAAKASGLKSDSTKFFKSSDRIKNLGSAEIFWNAASQLKDKQTSSVLLNESGYFIIKLKSAKPIDEAKFTKEKEDLSKKLLAVKKEQTFVKFSEQLMKKAQ